MNKFEKWRKTKKRVKCKDYCEYLGYPAEKWSEEEMFFYDGYYINITEIMKQLDSNLKSIFPNAKYVESIEWQIEDDYIYLTDKLHIQVCEDGEYLLYEKIGLIYKHHCINKDLQKVINVAITIAFKNKNFSLN